MVLNDCINILKYGYDHLLIRQLINYQNNNLSIDITYSIAFLNNRCGITVKLILR